MQRRGLLGAAALVGGAARTRACAGHGAQEPIVFGVITPLSPPGETALGQLAKRGAEIGAEYLNEKGGVLGRKVALSIQDSAGKNEQGVAAYRRLVSSEKAVAVFGFIHSAASTSPSTRWPRRWACRPWAPRPAPATSRPSTTTSPSAPMRSIRRAPPPGSAGSRRTSGSASASSPRPPTTASASPRRPRSRTRSKNLGLEIQTIMFDRTTTDLLPQLLQVKAFKPDAIVNVGVGQPLDLMITQAHTVGLLPRCAMVTSYDAPARPQFWQLHGDKGVGINFIAFYSPKSELSRCRQGVRQALPGEVQRAAGLCGAQRLRQRARLRAGDREGEDDRAEGDDQGARGGLVHGLVDGARHLPARGRGAVAQLVAAADGPALYGQGSDAGDAEVAYTLGE